MRYLLFLPVSIYTYPENHSIVAMPWYENALPGYLPVLPRVHQQVLSYLQIYFSDNFQIAFLQQVIIRQNAACNRIFNGHHTTITFFFIDSNLYHIPESSAGNHFYIFSKKLRSHLVKTAFIALDRSTTHLRWKFNIVFADSFLIASFCSS